METRLVEVLALLACVSPAAAQRVAPSPPPPPPPGWSAFVRSFDAFAVGDSVVGGSVLVLRDGRVLAHHEYGFADRALGQRVDERTRSEEHTSELQSLAYLVCRLLLEKKKKE